MAINLETQYPGKVAPSSAAYPYGAARNVTLPNDGTGTPFEAALVNDVIGFQQSLLTDAGIVPSGDPDEVGASQYLQAMTSLTGRVFATISDMIACTTLHAGDRVTTFANQNGAAVTQKWVVVGSTSKPYDGGAAFALTGSGLIAEQIFGRCVLVEQYGAVADGATDSTAAFATAMAAHGVVYGVFNTISTPYLVTDLAPNHGEQFWGVGVDKTWIRVATNTTAIKILGKRFAGVAHCTFVGQSTTGTTAVQIGQRGTAPLATDSQICQHTKLDTIRFAGLQDGVLGYASNTGAFNELFFETCDNGFTLQPVGQAGGGGSAGNCNGNVFTACRAYACGASLNMLPNLDGGNDCMHNIVDFYSEAHTVSAFNVTGYDNQLSLYADTSGGGYDYNVVGHNFFTPRDSANSITQAQLKSGVTVYAKGSRMYLGVEFTQKQDITLSQFGVGGGQIITSQITGNGDKCVLRVQNTNPGGSGEVLTLNCMADAPIGFELLLVHVINGAGFYLTEPATGGPWTKLNWPSSGGYAMAFSPYSRARIVKVDASTLMYLNS